MIKVDEVGLGVLSSSLWTISGVMTYLPTVETGIVCVSGPLSHSSLVSSLMPSSLATLSSPIVWCTASRQIHWHRGVIHGQWGIGGVELWSSSSSLPS